MLSRFIQGYWRLADWDMSPRQRLAFIKAHLEIISKCGICVAGPESVAHYQSGRQVIIASVEESLQ